MNGVLIGYARVSTDDQDLTVQTEQLTAVGCKRIYQEKISGAKGAEERPEFKACIAFLREGDTLIITRLDRMGRSARDLLDIVATLAERRIGLRVLNQPGLTLDDSSGRLFFQLLAVIAEFETNIRKERQREGVERAKAAGVYKGRPVRESKFNRRKVIETARKYHDIPYCMSASRIAKLLSMSRRQLYRLTEGAEPPIWGVRPDQLIPNPAEIDVRADRQKKSR